MHGFCSGLAAVGRAVVIPFHKLLFAQMVHAITFN
jgi:hypothetical protein